MKQFEHRPYLVFSCLKPFYSTLCSVFDNVGQTNSTLEVQTSQPTECSSGTFAHNFMSSASSVCEDGSDIFQRSDKSFCQWLFSCCFSKTSTL